jgi:hypothetical protein
MHALNRDKWKPLLAICANKDRFGGFLLRFLFMWFQAVHAIVSMNPELHDDWSLK